MSDPAVEAAERALGHPIPVKPLPEFAPYSTVAITAAREMAKPIRDLHKPVQIAGTDLTVCRAGCYDYWPCDTAKLIYTTEELGRNDGTNKGTNCDGKMCADGCPHHG